MYTILNSHLIFESKLYLKIYEDSCLRDSAKGDSCHQICKNVIVFASEVKGWNECDTNVCGEIRFAIFVDEKFHRAIELSYFYFAGNHCRYKWKNNT